MSFIISFLETFVPPHFPRPPDGYNSLAEVIELKDLKGREGPRRRVSVTRQMSFEPRENNDDQFPSTHPVSTSVDDSLATENCGREREESESEALVHRTEHPLQQQTALRQRANNMLKRTPCFKQNKKTSWGIITSVVFVALFLLVFLIWRSKTTSDSPR